MNQSITFTLGDVVGLIGAVMAFLVSINAGVIVLVSWYKKLRRPEDVQNDRLKSLEERMETLERAQRYNRKDFEETFSNLAKLEVDNKKFQKIIIESLHALSEHAIDGNHTDGLKKAAESLNNYINEKTWGSEGS